VTTAARPSTIRDVAKLAGVSTATVSRALRGGIGVEPDTRARVEQAARELRYRPSGVARSLKLRATQTIGLIVTDIENPFFPQVVRAVEDAARLRDYAVILADGRLDASREIQSLEVLAGRQVDGLLIASSALTERHRSWIDDRPCPVVIINSGPTAADVPAVLSDNEAGGRLAAEHVLDLGHQRLAYVGASASSSVAAEERMRGVRSALQDHDGDTDDLAVAVGDGGVAAGETGAAAVLRRRPQTTALICYNDLTAVGALRGLRSTGLRVPQDVSVVGFDDIELAPYVDPALTTIRQDTEGIGCWAVDTLLDAIEASGTVPATTEGRRSMVHRVPVELVIRHSTGAPRAHAR
jgi:DNA-binding LacI/PurR family transcriptional regulator